MNRLGKWLQISIPLAVAVVAAGIKIHAGQLGAPLILVTLGGLLLGWLIVLVLKSLAVLMGVLPGGQTLSDRRLLQLERDKALLLRSIKEIEFDAELQRLDPVEAAALGEPLRQRALRLLRLLDQVRLDKPRSVQEQIEQELARRLDASKGEEGR